MIKNNIKKTFKEIIKDLLEKTYDMSFEQEFEFFEKLAKENINKEEMEKLEKETEDFPIVVKINAYKLAYYKSVISNNEKKRIPNRLNEIYFKDFHCNMYE